MIIVASIVFGVIILMIICVISLDILNDYNIRNSLRNQISKKACNFKIVKDMNW